MNSALGDVWIFKCRVPQGNMPHMHQRVASRRCTGENLIPQGKSRDYPIMIRWIRTNILFLNDLCGWSRYKTENVTQIKIPRVTHVYSQANLFRLLNSNRKVLARFMIILSRVRNSHAWLPLNWFADYERNFLILLFDPKKSKDLFS